MPPHDVVFSSLQAFWREERAHQGLCLLMAGGEQGFRRLGDPVECALCFPSDRAHASWVAHPRGKVAPGWSADTPADASLPEHPLPDMASRRSARDETMLCLTGICNPMVRVLWILSRDWLILVSACAAARESPYMGFPLRETRKMRRCQTESSFGPHQLPDRVGEPKTKVRATGAPRSRAGRRAAGHAWGHEWMDRCRSALAVPIDPWHACGHPEPVL